MALTEIKTSGIADDAVTTDKLANAINTERTANTAKTSLEDNAVTLAKMAGGTDGQIITYVANGDPVAVGPGTDGQVLTSTGAGSPPAFETINIPAGVGGATGVDFNDDVKARFGTGNDLEIYHDASHSYIHNSGTGNLQVKSDESLYLRVNDTEESINCNKNGSVQLYHDNTKQCETSANGLAFPAGKGIDFSAQTATSASGSSTDSELLDHYEEGTWTPDFRGYHHSNGVWQSWSMTTAGTRVGRYIRIGKMVHAWAKFNGFQADSGLSYVSVIGLPFTPSPNYVGVGSSGYADCFDQSQGFPAGGVNNHPAIGILAVEPDVSTNMILNTSSNRTYYVGCHYQTS